MECSVGRCAGAEPLELTVSAVAVVARGEPGASELAEEAAPWPAGAARARLLAGGPTPILNAEHAAVHENTQC